jgi:hypothetical protein
VINASAQSLARRSWFAVVVVFAVFMVLILKGFYFSQPFVKSAGVINTTKMAAVIIKRVCAVVMVSMFKAGRLGAGPGSY